MVIDYKAILQTIGQELSDVNSDGIKFILTDEQSFIKNKDNEPDFTYIVVRFNRASTNLGVAAVPITLTIMGFANEVEQTQAFFNKFINTYNLKVENDITQIWMSPEVILNFNDTFDGYRSLFTVSGQFLIGDGTVRVSTLQFLDKNNNWENVPVIGFTDVTEASLNPQPYPNTNGRTKSYGSFITNSFSVVTYPNGDLDFIQKIMKWKYDFTANHQNDDFYLKGTFVNSDTNLTESAWKCRSANFSQKIGDIPTIEITFTR